MISERMSESGDEWGFEVKRGHLSCNQFFFSSAQSGEWERVKKVRGREERERQK